MNDRIKELYEQAEDFAEQDLARQKSEAQPLYRPGEYDDMIQEKFAALIVQECCMALNPMLRDMISRGQGVDLIKQHFGVE